MKTLCKTAPFTGASVTVMLRLENDGATAREKWMRREKPVAHWDDPSFIRNTNC